MMTRKNSNARSAASNIHKRSSWGSWGLEFFINLTVLLACGVYSLKPKMGERELPPENMKTPIFPHHSSYSAHRSISHSSPALLEFGPSAIRIPPTKSNIHPRWRACRVLLSFRAATPCGPISFPERKGSERLVPRSGLAWLVGRAGWVDPPPQSKEVDSAHPKTAMPALKMPHIPS